MVTTGPDALFVGEPAFEHRGFMLDVSRDRVPTLATLEWLIARLADLRFTELQLYVEHTFTYTGHETVWRDASPLTHDDMAWIRSVAADRGVALVANMNGFGHMERWLAHDAYRDRAECPDGTPSPIGGDRVAPTCLEPTADNAAFAVGLAREMLVAVGGDRIHVGGDEPFELGDCRSAERAGTIGRDRLYIEHLRRIVDPLVADGVGVMFWADLFRRDPSLLGEIPTGATGVVWNYEAPSETNWTTMLPPELALRLGMPDDAHLGFESHCRLFVESESPFWVAPGTATWNTILGRNRNAAANVVDAASVGARHGAGGFLLTDWGDNGHHQPLIVSLPSMVRAAVAAWSGGDDGTGLDVGPVIDEMIGAEPGTGAMIDRLGGLGESLGPVSPNASPIFTTIASTGLGSFGTADRRAVDGALQVVREALAGFAAGPIGGDRGDVMAAEMVAACGLAELGLRRLRGDEPDAGSIERAVARQRAAWLASSRPGGLGDSLAKLRF